MRRLLDTSVKYFDSFQNNFEELKVEWGETVKMLDATLCNGTTPINVLSITTKEDEDTKYEGKYWISSITLEGNSLGLYNELSVIEIQSCPIETYNREFRVQKAEGNTIKVAFDKETFPDKPKDVISIEGTTLRQPPLGYEIVDQVEHKRLYTSKDEDFNFRLRVDNSCPKGYDPSWSKFSRVSIYNETDRIDDYEVTMARCKAPYSITDPNRAEESSGSGSGGVFGYTKWYQNLGNNSHISYETYSTASTSYWRVIGDSKTFYFLITDFKSYQNDHWNVYSFGLYRKYLDLNSNLNCMLVSYADGRTANSGTHYGKLSNFPVLDEYIGKFLLDLSQENNQYMPNESPGFCLWSIGIPSSISGTGKTYSSLVQSHPKINLFPVYMRSNGSMPTIIGIMRGYHYIGTDLKFLTDRKMIEPKTVKFDREQKKYFVFLSATGYANNNYLHGYISFSLENWDTD